MNDARGAGPEVTQRSSVALSKKQQKAFASDAPAVRSQRQLRSQAEPDATGTAIGGEKNWLLLDDINGYDATPYVLRGVGEKIEVWVQADLNYPEGDCRNDGVRNVVTDTQVQDLVKEFDSNIYPKESKAFSVAPDRDGTQLEDIGFGAPLYDILGGGDPNYYKGDGDKTVTLISNVRDANFYDPTTPDGATYIAGFFSPVYNEGFDRNVMSIDSYDWFHRTGANPPDEAAAGAPLCQTKQPARPRLYEGTFAHEYQHLLEYYQDDAEETWLNEGLSDYAQTLVGYVDSRAAFGESGADNHITCFQGFYGSTTFPYCGAENSLTRWEDQGGPSVLSDYGAAYTFLTYLSDQFGEKAITYLHRDQRQGLDSLKEFLDDNGPGLSPLDVIHDWAAQMAFDRFIDNGAKGLTKDQKQRFTSAKLSSAIDWAWSGSYDSPGAPANGSDYVLGTKGRPINANTITSMSFKGAKVFEPDPLLWSVDNGALYSGEGDNLDRSAVYDVKVPATAASLTFSNRYNIEQGWDFGVVQVSTDKGKTFTSLSNSDTTTEHAEGAENKIVQNLPGLTGLVTEFKQETFDLSAYAGKDILLSFRYLTDGAAQGTDETLPSGWWVKDVKVGDTTVTSGSTTAGARSATEASPIPVAGWKLQAIGWKLDGSQVRYADVKLNSSNSVFLTKKAVRKMFKGSDRIGFIVTLDDPDEVATKNANYRLRVNGVLQPGGGGSADGTSTDPDLARTLPISKRSNFR